jgi:amino acid adenylation domain-containing protein
MGSFMVTGVCTFPCSFAQQRLWFLNRLIPGECLYNIPAALRIERILDPLLIRQAIDELVQRHESLRTTFHEADGEPVQTVASTLTVPLEVLDLRRPSGPALEEALEIAEAEARAPFDLERGPLLRLSLLQIDDRDFVLLVTMHHIVSDGWSLDVFFRELSELYDAFSRGDSPSLPPLPAQYADYAVWQHEWLRGPTLDGHLAYWRAELADAPLLQLATDHPRPAVSTFRGRRAFRHLDADLTTRIEDLGREEGATPFMTLLAGFALLLARYADQDDVVIGTLTAGRDRSEIEGVIGFFVNTLPLRLRLGGRPTFREALRRVRDTALDAYAHADCPFEKLVEELQPERDVSRNPLVQITFQVFNPPGARQATPDAAAQVLEISKGTSKFDLACDVWNDAQGLSCRMEYSTDLFDERTVDRFLRHYERLLRAAVATPDAPAHSLPLLDDDERHRQVVLWNRTERPYARSACIHELFEAQVRLTPEAPAVVFGREAWTYRELDGRANGIAAALRSAGVGPEVLVGVCMRRTGGLVAALVGIWKAGGAYVAIDATYPAERRRFMLADSAARLVLSDGLLAKDEADSPGWDRADIEIIDIERIPPAADAPAPSGVAPHHLAYLLFTSGSTGTPKGVAIEHRNTSALLHWAGEAYARHELSGVLASTSICFDLSVFEIFAPLCTGGAVILAENVLHLATLPAADRVTLVNTVPSALAELLVSGAVPPGVRVINVAGEPLTAHLVEAAFEATSVDRVHNLYGPTEDTTYSTGATIRRGEAWTPTIGRPLPNHRAYVLDAGRQPVPVGVTGELYLGGDGVARGYWNRPELTSERFLPSPFVDGDRLYRTGDLARYRHGGEIEFLGRCDQQVKVRGFRIEPGEIEAALMDVAGVAEAVVVCEGEPGVAPRLLAFVVSANATLLDGAALRRELAYTLPPHMLPSNVTVIENMPLTPNGKVDRRALVARTAQPIAGGAPLRPRTELERTIARIWRDILELEDVGVTDSFFDLGGHSLLMLRAHTRLRGLLGELPLLDLFRYPTIESLARHLSRPEDEPSERFEDAQRRALSQRARNRDRYLAHRAGANPS